MSLAMMHRTIARPASLPRAVILIVAGLLPAAASAQSGTWITSAAGTYNWSIAGDWQSGVVADGANNTANFTTAGLTGNMVVTLDSARTLGSLVFNNPTNSFSWTVNGGNPLTLSTSAAGGPTIAVNNFTSATIAAPLAGTQGFTTTGEGTMTLTGTNTYSGGTIVSDGTLAVASDAALGTGPVTVAALGMVNYLATTSTARSFNLTSGGTVAAAAGATVTINVGALSAGFLGGAGTFTTGAAGGVLFTNMTSEQSTTIVSANPTDQFVSLNNNGTLMVAPGVHSTVPATFTGLFNQGSGSFTLGAAAQASVSGFQTYGVVTINPAVVGSGQFTLLTNTGPTPLAFNIGSRTFLGTPATAGPPSNPSFVAGIDLHGQNIDIVGGLFVNNGFVVDSVGGGEVIVDAGALYKGAGYSGVPIVTQNGGKVQAGNSPGKMFAAHLIIGPGGINNFGWQINDASGTAGPLGATGQLVSGWSQVQATILTNPITHQLTTGSLTWTATSTPGNQFQITLETLVNPTPIGSDNPGLMANFDPSKPYSWPIMTYQGTYTGPTDSATLTADTRFDLSQFQNPIAGQFSLALDPVNGALDVVYSPLTAVPEPGTLALVGVAAGALAWRRRCFRIGV
jgi:autotransporter-associated beta strand protein